MPTSSETNDLTALYVGYFNRAPDPAGLAFWSDQIGNGRELSTIAEDFATSDEAVGLYSYLTNPDPSDSDRDAFFTAIYANLFNREPDPEGLAFWTEQLEAGNVSVADMIEAIINGAQNDEDAGTYDKAMLDNKIEVGRYFAQKTGEDPDFEYDAEAEAAAHAVLDGVTENPATVAEGKTETDTFLNPEIAAFNAAKVAYDAALATAVASQAAADDAQTDADAAEAAVTDLETAQAYQTAAEEAKAAADTAVSDAEAAVAAAAELSDAAAATESTDDDAIAEADSIAAADALAAATAAQDTANDEVTNAATVVGTYTDGETFALTDSVDTFTGTNGVDTFTAAAENSLNSSDLIDGGTGYDVLDISAGAFETGAAPILNNVEQINNANVAASQPVLDLSRVSDVQQIWTDFTDAGSATAYAKYENGSLDTVFGIRGATGINQAIDIDFTAAELDGDSTLNLALADNDYDTNFGVAGSLDGIENIVIDVAEGNEGRLFFGANGDNLETLTVTGDGDVSIAGSSTSYASDPTGGTGLTFFDASTTTGEVSFVSGALTEDYTATGGSGDNTLDFSAALSDGTISGGAGDDVLIGGAGDDILNGGAGADTMTGGGGDNLFVIEGGITAGSFDIITDFLVGDNNIQFVGGVAGTEDNFVIVDGVSTSFSEALQAANLALEGDIVYSAVKYNEGDGNEGTYLFADLNADGSANAVVQVMGVTEGTNANFDYIVA